MLTPLLRKLRDDCEQHGVELVVVALPIDVQVSDREWEKYPEAEPVDMESSMVLLDDLVEDVHALGVRAVNVTEALRNAEPGAFLYGDIHMTPTGHAAVATAVAAVLEEPPPLRLPSTGLAAGRTWIPRHQDWLRTPERTVRGSSRARCETVQLKEWLSVSCQRVDGRRPTGVTVHEGDHGEARVTRTSESVTLVTPLFVGEPFRATFHWESYGQELTASWLESEEPEIAFGARQPEHGRRLEVSELEGRLCECARAVRPESRCVTEGDPLEPDDVGRHVTSYVRDCEETCAHLAGGNLTACDATHPNDCEQYLACAEGSLGALPACGSGEIAVGGAGTCKVACDGRHPCPNGGACRPWQGAGYCE